MPHADSAEPAGAIFLALAVRERRSLRRAHLAMRSQRTAGAFGSFLLQLLCAPPTPSAGDALKRKDIELVVL
jgi:hypothetical protein